MRRSVGTSSMVNFNPLNSKKYKRNKWKSMYILKDLLRILIKLIELCQAVYTKLFQLFADCLGYKLYTVYVAK